MKKDPKTTAVAIVGGILAALAWFDVVVPEVWATPITIGVTMILGFLAADSKKQN